MEAHINRHMSNHTRVCFILYLCTAANTYNQRWITIRLCFFCFVLFFFFFSPLYRWILQWNFFPFESCNFECAMKQKRKHYYRFNAQTNRFGFIQRVCVLLIFFFLIFVFFLFLKISRSLHHRVVRYCGWFAFVCNWLLLFRCFSLVSSLFPCWSKLLVFGKPITKQQMRQDVHVHTTFSNQMWVQGVSVRRMFRLIHQLIPANVCVCRRPINTFAPWLKLRIRRLFCCCCKHEISA